MNWFLITIAYCIVYAVVIAGLFATFSRAVTGDQRQGEAFGVLIVMLLGWIILVLLRITGVF